MKFQKAFSLIELSIVVLIIGVVTIVALNGKSLVIKANCVVSSFGSKTITSNLDNPTELTKNRSTTYETCVSSGGVSSGSSNNGTCSGATCSSCKTLLTANPGTASGTYSIDPDGAGGNPSFTAYCDMTTDGGGWTLVLKNAVNNSDFSYSSPYWTSGTVFNGSDFSLWSGSNALYQSYSTVSGTEFKVQFESNGSLIITTSTTGTAKAKATGATYKEIECSTSGATCWNQINASCTTLRTTFDSTWLLQGGYIGKMINRNTGVPIRFGILANNENTDEGSMDSGLGIGLSGSASSGNQVNCCGVTCDYPSNMAADTSNTRFWKALLLVR